MAHLQYLVFNNENILMPASYSVSLADVEADSGSGTDAGTTQRDVVREGVVQIGVTFRVSKKWLNKFAAYKKAGKHYGRIPGYGDHEHRKHADVH